MKKLALTRSQMGVLLKLYEFYCIAPSIDAQLKKFYESGYYSNQEIFLLFIKDDELKDFMEAIDEATQDEEVKAYWQSFNELKLKLQNLSSGFVGKANFISSNPCYLVNKIVILFGTVSFSNELIEKLKQKNVEVFSSKKIEKLKTFIKDRQETNGKSNLRFMFVVSKEVKIQLMDEVFAILSGSSKFPIYTYKIGEFNPEDYNFSSNIIDCEIENENDIDWTNLDTVLD